MLSEKLKQAITMVKSGDKLAARKLLVEILDGEPTNETAWLWFTDTLNTDAEKKIALEGLLKINPASQAARLGLERLAGRLNLSEIVAQAPVDAPKMTEYQPVETDLVPELPAVVKEEPAVLEVKDSFVPVESDGPVEGSVRAEATVSEVEPSAVVEAQPEAVAVQAQPAQSNKFVLPSGIARILLILVAFAVMGGAIYWFGSMLGLFPTTETTCRCTETDAYLLRVQDRVSRWLNNQALYVLAETHGDAPQNTNFGQQLLDEEKKESVPVCLKDLHETLISTFENHIKYGEAIKSKDAKLIKYYRGIESAMQDTLKSEFEKLKSTLVCTP